MERTATPPEARASSRLARLYPALARLERQAFLDAEWGVSDNNRRGKFYRLTAEGRRRLRQETADWDRSAAAGAAALRANPADV